jgi:metal-responsive CopG/Arc/MetJ family transcriptional regulator
MRQPLETAGFTMPVEMSRALDDYAHTNRVSRSQAIRSILATALGLRDEHVPIGRPREGM